MPRTGMIGAMSRLMCMFIGPILAMGLIIVAVQDSLGVYTVMHHLASHVKGLAIVYVAVMFSVMLYGGWGFGKLLEEGYV